MQSILELSFIRGKWESPMVAQRTENIILRNPLWYACINAFVAAPHVLTIKPASILATQPLISVFSFISLLFLFWLFFLLGQETFYALFSNLEYQYPCRYHIDKVSLQSRWRWMTFFLILILCLLMKQVPQMFLNKRWILLKFLAIPPLIFFTCPPFWRKRSAIDENGTHIFFFFSFLFSFNAKCSIEFLSSSLITNSFTRYQYWRT